MTEKTEAQTEEIQTEEQTAARKPDGVLRDIFQPQQQGHISR
ncbi:hypothetical protein [Bifidobacterium merycicum]|nr:hypothetical protein [Bifidobacterium merycicum]